MCVGRMHQQGLLLLERTPTGSSGRCSDCEVPTKLEVVSRKEREKERKSKGIKCKLFAHSKKKAQTVGYWVLKISLYPA